MRLVYFCTHGRVGYFLYNHREATCTEAGYTGDTVCAECEELVKRGTTIPALGHNMGAGVVTKEPTVSEAGVMSYYCTRCGVLMETEQIPCTSGRKKKNGGKLNG